MTDMKKSKIGMLFSANKVFFGELLKSGRFYLLFQVALLLLVAPLSYLTTYAPKKFIDNITINKNLRTALLWIVLLLAIGLFQGITQNILQIAKKRAVFHAKVKHKYYVYKKLEQIYLTFFEDSDNLDIYNKSMSYVESGGETFFNLLVTTITSLLTLTTMTFISLQFEWWLWIIIISLAIIEFVGERILKKVSFKYEMKRVGLDRKQRYYNGLPTSKDVLAEIKVNSNMDFFFDKYKESYKENRDLQEKHEIKLQLFSYLYSLPSTLFTFFCYWDYFFLDFRGNCETLFLKTFYS